MRLARVKFKVCVAVKDVPSILSSGSGSGGGEKCTLCIAEVLHNTLN